MSHRSGHWAALVTLLALTAAAPAADPPEKMPVPEEGKALDAKVFSTLRDVINRGADLYNSGEMAACYRLYEGSLMTLRPLIDHRPELQKAISAGIASAERDPLVWRRAFTLRNVIDKVRAEVNPKKVVKNKLPVPTPEDKKPQEKPVEKVPVKKQPEDKKPVEKKVIEKKPEDKKPAEKKPDDKKPIDKKSEDKDPDEKLPPPRPEEKKPDDKKPAEKKAEDKKKDDKKPDDKKKDDKKDDDKKSDD
jgi:hypothetical protein